jgi:meiosis-specific APC/C activator protein AMA1
MVSNPRAFRASANTPVDLIDALQDTSRKTSKLTDIYDGPADDDKAPPAPATLPRLKPRSKDTEYFRRPSLKAFESNSSSKSGSSLQSPDRFLPRRRPALDSAIQSFRANKEPKALSTEEKLLRHKDVSPDAFNPRRRISSPMPQANRPISRRNYSGRRSGSGGLKTQFSGEQRGLIDLQVEVFLLSRETLRAPMDIDK